MKKSKILFVLPLMMAAAGLCGEAVRYEVAGETFEGYVETAAEGAPMVLLVHDWDGLTDYEMTRADMLVEMGYSVFCADLFGAGVRPATLQDKQKCTGELDGDRPRMRMLMQGALDAAGALDLNTDNCAAMGYCFGGTAVLEFARTGADLKAWASFHGGLALPARQDYSKTRGEILILHGSADSHVRMEHFSKLAEDMETAGVRNEMITYGGAPHGWTVFGSGAYREDADRKSWKRFSAFLDEVLRSKGE
ncbi:MAG TPA: dienelactone hydrolase family protein [Pontiella sp.]|nr:dienelactone hydrolase family protein [Pontiella sp.]